MSAVPQAGNGAQRRRPAWVLVGASCTDPTLACYLWSTCSSPHPAWLHLWPCTSCPGQGDLQQDALFMVMKVQGCLLIPLHRLPPTV